MIDRNSMITEMENRLKSTIESRFPIETSTTRVSLISLNFTPAETSISKELDIKRNGGTLQREVWARLSFEKLNGSDKEEKRWKVLNLPFPSLRNTFIINGTEKIIQNQSVSKNGIFTASKNPEEASTSIRLSEYRGPGLEVAVEGKKLKFRVGTYSIPGISFLTAIGITEAEIAEIVGGDEFGRELRGRNSAMTANHINALYTAFGKNISPSASTDESKIQAVRDYFSGKGAKLSEDEQNVVKMTVGTVGATSFNYDVIKDAFKRTVNVARGSESEDDRDDLLFQTIKNPIDIVDEVVAKELDAFVRRTKNALSSRKANAGYAATGVGNLRKSLDSFFASDERVSNTEETNPLLLMTEHNTVISTGPGGLTEDMLRTNRKPRNIKRTGINRLDPVHTPESGKIGLSLRLSQDAEINSGTITSKFLGVTNGVAEDNDRNTTKLTPQQEYNAYVAFNSPRHVIKDGSSYRFRGDTTPGRYMGTITDIPVEKVQYLDRRPQNLFGLASNLVPFGSHNDGNRMLMGANMQTQAIELINKEAPLVQVDSGDGKTYEEIVGEQSFVSRAHVNGTVKEVHKNKIVIETSDGKNEEVEIYDHFPVNRSNFIDSKPVVKPGDKVKAGDLIADGWHTKGGKLALGLNANVAYMPFKGYNFEDGIVVSESFAKRMATEEMITEEVTIGGSHVGGKGSGAKKLLQIEVATGGSLDKLDEDGLIKVGETVGPGDILVGRLRKRSSDENVESGILRSLFKSEDTGYSDASHVIPRGSYTKGKVVSVSSRPGGNRADDKETIVVEILTEKTLKEQDKISGRHGNKGTITKILSDNEMPKTPDGEAVEVIFSPTAIPSRKNVGQLLEVNKGLAARKKGLDFVAVSDFDPDAKASVERDLEEIGMPDGKTTLINPDTGKPYENAVTMGPMYVMKLKHKADDKIQSRSGIEGAAPNMKFMTPTKVTGSAAGEKHNPQRLGEMEIRALQGHKAVYNLLEATTLKGDGAGDARDRVGIFRVLSGKDDPETLSEISGTPESLKVFKDLATVAGINVAAKHGNQFRSLDEHFSSMAAVPMKDKDIIRMVGKDNKVLNPAKIFVSKIKGDKAEDGGLYDEKIFGGLEETDRDEMRLNRKKWGYAEMRTPLPNPLFMQNASANPYKILTGLSNSDLDNLIKKGTHVLITDPGDTGLKKNSLVTIDEADNLEFDGKKFEYKVGGEALESMLSQVSVKKELKATEKALKTLKGAELDAEYKKYRVLKNLSDNDLDPTDLLNKVVPISPVYTRPMIKTGDTIMQDDLTTLYSNLLIANKTAENVYGDEMKDYATAEDKALAFRSIYGKYENLIGTTQFEDKSKGDSKKGIKQVLFGETESKSGIVRDKLLSKRVDYSGRAVIGVDPNLGLDEAAIPAEMAKNIYKPFIIKELVNMGVARNENEAQDRLDNVDDPLVIEAMNRVAENRPVMLNRAPSLHKLSVQAFKPKILTYDERGNAIRGIKLNPLVVGAFNADFDGDQMSAHVPLTEKARKEAIDLMMPSKNLVNPRNGEIVAEIKHEMVQGIYYLTMKHDAPNDVEERKFSDIKELKRAFDSGDVRTHDPVKIGNRSTTAGQFLFNMSLPKEFRRWNMVIGDSEVKEILKEMHEDKSISDQKLVETLERLKTIGFAAATMSGMSIGIKDFAMPNKVKLTIDEAVNAADSLKLDPGAFIAKYKDIEDSIESTIKDSFSNDPSLRDNPLRVMMASGARGNPGQIRRMGATVGIGRDINNQLTAPVTSSHLDGLMPHEYHLHSYDARKGLSDRALGTAAPGAMTRDVWASIQDMTVTEKDCKTTNGIEKPVGIGIKGRYLAEGIAGVAVRNTVISKEVLDKLVSGGIKTAKVRSPIGCEAQNGVCQKCYGLMPGTTNLPTIGEPIGIVASQSLGEPITQMTMNTFHTSGVNASASMGLPRIGEILTMKPSKGSEAVISTSDGVVTITDDPSSMYVVVNVGGKDHRVHRGVPIKVKSGDIISKGDFITVGDMNDFMDDSLVKNKDIIFTGANPNDLIKFKKDSMGKSQALMLGKQYTANSLDYAVAKTLNSTMGKKIDSRHLEVLADKLGDKVKITDTGDSPFVNGQWVSIKEVEKWNKRNPGMTPADYDVEMATLRQSYNRGNDNWFSNLGSSAPASTLSTAALFGQVDKLNDPRGNQMAGLLQPIGEGFQNFGEAVQDKVQDIFSGAKSFTNNLGKSIVGFFK